MDTYLGKSLGDFQILRERGRGGMGVVYEAVQQSLRRKVALKILPPSVSLDDKAVERFRREASSAARLHHTNIVPIYFVGSELGNHFYAMEYIDGKSLAQIIRELSDVRNAIGSESGGSRTRVWEGRFLNVLRAPTEASAPESALVPTETMGSADISSASEPAAAHSSLTPVSASPSAAEGAGRPAVRAASAGGWWKTVAELAGQLAEALHYAHGEGVVHRDIKPSNIMVTRSGRPMIFDFGLAMDMTSAELTLSGALLGTPLYMSPEQAMSRVKVDHRTDVYSLGVSLYELITLVPPFQGTREEILKQILFKDPPAPRRINPAIPHDLQTIIIKATEKDPDRRYSTAGDLAADLRRFVSGDPILARPAGFVSQITKQVRRKKRGLAIAAIIVASLAVGAWSYSAYLRSQRELEASRRQLEQGRRTVTQVRDQTAAEIERIRQQEAGDRLLADLASADPEKRLVAVRALGQSADPRVIAALQQAYGDRDPRVREQVVTALGRQEDRAVLPTLRRALDDPERTVRDAAVGLIGQFQDRESLPALVSALRRDMGDPLGRFRYGFPIQCSAGRADTPLLAEVWVEGLLTNLTVEWVADRSAVPLAVQLVAEGSDARRQEAARLLASLGDERAVPALLGALRGNATVSVQQACVAALSNLIRPEDVPALVEAMLASGSAEVRDALMELIKSLPRTATATLLPRIAQADDRTLQEFSALLAKTGASQSRETLRSFLRPDSPAGSNSLVRAWALTGLRDLRDAANLDHAAHLARDPAPLVKHNSLASLAQFDTPRAREALLAALEDTDPEAVRIGAGGLALFDSAAGDAVAARAAHPNASVRRTVAGALAPLERPEPLLKMLRDSDAGVRQLAAASLGRLQHSPAVPDLATALEDTNAGVRNSAAAALGSIGHRLAVAGLCKALEDTDQQVVQAAAQALANIGVSDALPHLCDAAIRSIGAGMQRASLPGLTSPLPTTLPATTTARTMTFSATTNRLIEALGRFRQAGVDELAARISRAELSQQKRIVALLGRLGQRRAAEAVLPLLKHEDAELRAVAAEALGELFDSAVVPALIDLLDDADQSVRAGAVASLGKLPLPQAPPKLLALADDPRSGIHQHLGMALAGLRDPASREALVKLANSDHPAVRREAVAALAGLGDPTAAMLVRRTLDETDRFVRFRLVTPIGALPAPEAVPLLADIARHDHPYVAAQAITRLGAIDDPAALDALREAARSARVDVREAAIKSLARQPRGAGLPALIAALEDDHTTVSKTVGTSLKVLYAPGVPPPMDDLRAGLKHEDARVRAICADALGSVRDSATVGLLLPLLEDADHRVVLQAAEALGSVGDPQAAAGLRKLTEHPDRMLRGRALLELGRLGDRESARRMLDALRQDPQGHVRVYAAFAIGLLAVNDDPEALSVLTEVLSGWDSFQRRAAAFSLGEIGGAPAVAALRAATHDQDEDVAAAAVQALAVAAGPEATGDLLDVIATTSPKVARAGASNLQWHGGEAVLPALESLFVENATLRHTSVAVQLAICRRLRRELSPALRRELNQELIVYRKAAHSSPDNAGFHNELAWLLSLSGQDLDEALTHARQAVFLAPQTAAYLHTLADVHRSRGEYTDALAVLSLPACRRSTAVSPRLIETEIRLTRERASSSGTDQR